MKKTFVRIIVLIVLIVLFYFFRPIIWWAVMDHNGGFYDSVTGWLECGSEFVCLHEYGHQLDDQLGRPSSTQEFHYAFEEFALTTTNGALLKSSLDYKANSSLYYRVYLSYSYYKEAYAEIYQVHGGRIEWMPEYLQEFYIE